MAAFGLVRRKVRFRFGPVPVSSRLEPSENVADSPDVWFRLMSPSGLLVVWCVVGFVGFVVVVWWFRGLFFAVFSAFSYNRIEIGMCISSRPNWQTQSIIVMGSRLALGGFYVGCRGSTAPREPGAGHRASGRVGHRSSQ